jgi:hypothetical protein
MSEQDWVRKAKGLIEGQRIVDVRYVTNEEAENVFAWDKRAIVLELEDGTLLIPQSDDEGNEAGALYMAKGDMSIEAEIIPTLQSAVEVTALPE